MAPYGFDKFTQVNSGEETEENTANGSMIGKFYSLLSSLDKTLKKYGNLAIGKGLRDLVGSPGEAPNPLKGGNDTISSSFKGVPIIAENTQNLNKELGNLLTSLSNGEESVSMFKSMGDQLETLTRHFDMFDDATKVSIDRLRETGEVSQELEVIFKKVSEELKNTSQENLKILTENLNKSKETTKSYFLEMSGVVVASVGTATAIMAPLISAGLDQQKQIIELSRSTDSLLSSKGNQEMFSRVTRNMSAVYGVELQEVRNLFAGVASDLGLNYSQNFENGFREVNPELEHYVKQSLILKKTADVEDKTLRGLVKAVKTVGVSSKDASSLVTVFTNSLVSLRANNRFTKEDVEEIATSIEEMITGLGFAAGWGEKEIKANMIQFTNFTNWLTDKAGEGGKEVSKMFAKNFSSLDNGTLLMNVIGIDPVTAREMMSRNQFAPIIENFAANMDQFNEKIDRIRESYKQRGIGNVITEQRVESEIRALLPDASEKNIRSFKDVLSQIKQAGGFVKQRENFSVGKSLPEAQEKLDEMYKNLAGMLLTLNGLKDKFLEVFGDPVVSGLSVFVGAFAKIATYLLDIVNLLPDFAKGIIGLAAGLAMTIGMGSALSSVFNLGKAFQGFLVPFKAYMKYVEGFLGRGVARATTGAASEITTSIVGEVAGSAIGTGAAATITKPGIRSMLAVILPLLMSPPVLLALATMGYFAYKAYDTYTPVTDTTGRDQQIPPNPGGFYALNTGGLRERKWTEDWSEGRYVNKWQDARESFFKTISEASANYTGAVINVYNIFKEYVIDPIYNLIKSLFGSVREKIFGPPEPSEFPKKKGWTESLWGRVKDYVGANDFRLPQDRGALKEMSQQSSYNWGSPNLVLSGFPGTDGWLSSGGLVNPAYALKPFQGLTPFSGTLTPASAVTTTSPEINAEYTPNVKDDRQPSLTDMELINILKGIRDNTKTTPANKSYSMFSPRNISENESLMLGKIDLADRSGMG